MAYGYLDRAKESRARDVVAHKGGGRFEPDSSEHKLYSRLSGSYQGEELVYQIYIALGGKAVETPDATLPEEQKEGEEEEKVKSVEEIDAEIAALKEAKKEAKKAVKKAVKK